MNEALVDLRKYDLADRLRVDLISIENLLSELENALDENEHLKEQIKELENTEDEEDLMDVCKRKMESEK